MMKKNSRNPKFKVLLFFTIMICLIQAFSIIPMQRSSEKNGNYWPYFYEELPPDSLDIVFLGNSHANSTFIPEIIDDILRTDSIIMSTSGESIYQTYFEYQEVLHRQSPPMVVVETYPIYDGLTQDELESWNYSFFFSMPLSLRKLVYAHQFFSDENLLSFYLPFTLFHSNWKDMQAVAGRVEEALQAFKDDEPVELPHQGYFNYMEPLSRGAQDPLTIVESDKCPLTDMQARLAVVEDILQVDVQQGGELVFIEAPQYRNEEAGCRAQVVDVVESYNGDYERLFQGQSPSRLWYADDQHVTQFGAIIASVETAELLAQKAGLEMDQEALAFYRSYFFRDYDLKVEDGQVKVSLIPFDEEAASNLYFTWTLERQDDGEDVFQIEGVRLLEQTFDLPDPDEEYSLDVGIYNLDGSYSLRGTFDHIKAE